MGDDERNIQARMHKTFEVLDREKALNRHNATKEVGSRDYIVYPRTESYEVRSAAVRQEGKMGKFVTWSRAEAMETAEKASRVGRDRTAAVYRYDHREMREELNRIYTNGERNPNHTRSR